MKMNEVKVGEVYYTKIGTVLCKVVVVSIVWGDPNSMFNKRTSFVVRREGEHMPLPKRRLAAALRLQNKKVF